VYQRDKELSKTESQPSTATLRDITHTGIVPKRSEFYLGLDRLFESQIAVSNFLDAGSRANLKINQLFEKPWELGPIPVPSQGMTVVILDSVDLTVGPASNQKRHIRL
jgi:hypothetical protein